MVRRAFTLIELLVVIAIIAILAAILFPVFAQAKLAAKKSVSLSNVKQVGLAGFLYVGDNDDVTPPLYYFDPNNLTLPSSFGFYYWPVLELPYTKSEQIFLCPMDTADDPSLHDAQGRTRFDPANGFHYYVLGANPSYGYNYRYLNQQILDAIPGPSGLPYHYVGISTTSINAPADTLAYAESTMKDKFDPNSNTTIVNPVGYSRVEPPSRWTATPAGYSGVPPYAPSQGQLWGRFDPKKMLVAWVDGHAKVASLDLLRGTGTTKDTQDHMWNGNP